MNQLTKKELEQIISLFIDGELDTVEIKKLEEYLTTHPAVAREIEILRTAKRSLSSKEKLHKNDWFWLKLSNKLEEKDFRTRRFLPNAKPIFALASLTAGAILVITAIYFKDAQFFNQYFLENKIQAENVYRNNIMTGNILPLFTNLNKDDVLNFALFGSLSIDSSKNTSLQVKNTEDKGSQIQIVRNNSISAPSVTVKDFANEIGFSDNQRDLIDSILVSYQERLQASVLVSENDEVAIHAELVDLNRAMVSTIAACLEPPQRSRFQKYLDIRKAPYAVVAVNSPKVPSHVILNKIPKMSRSNNYVVISPGTIEIAEMTINMDSIRDVARRQGMEYRKNITERMVAELAERQRRAEENMVTMGENRIHVQSSSGAFQINFERSAEAASPEIEMVEMVRPRIRIQDPNSDLINQVTVIGDSAFSFELPANDQTVRVFKRLPKGEFRLEVVDSMMREPKMKLLFKSSSRKREFDAKIREMKERENELIDIDSLLRESEKQQYGVPGKPEKPTKKLELGIVM